MRVLTEADKAVQAETGLIPPGRLYALRDAFRAMAADTAQLAQDRTDTDPHLAAALRGRSLAYRDAARMADRVLDGLGLPPHRNSSIRAKGRDARLRRTLRRASAEHPITSEL